MLFEKLKMCIWVGTRYTKHPLNVDAVVLKDFTILALVAWDGEVIEAWAKVYEICESVQAKVATILWALQLAKSENLQSIEVKGDNKKLCWCF